MNITFVEKDSLKLIWEQAQLSTPINHFQSYNWCLDLIESNQQQNYFVKCDDYFFPLTIINWHGTRVLTFLGGDAADYMYPFCADDFNFKQFLKLLSKEIKFDVFELRRTGKKKFNGFKRVKNFESSFQMVSETENLKDGVKKRIIADNQRQLKRLNEIGKLEYTNLLESEEIKKHFISFVEMKITQHEKMNVPCILSSTFWQSFYLNALLKQDFNSEVKWHFSVLMLNQIPISYHLGIVNPYQFIYLLPTYSMEYNKFSPGRIHMFELFNFCDQSKIKVFDFSIGAESYKSNFCNQETELFNYYAVYNLKGELYTLFQVLRNKLNSMTKIRNFVLKLKAMRSNR